MSVISPSSGFSIDGGLSYGGGFSAAGGFSSKGSARSIVTSWVNAVASNGGTVSSARQALYTTMVSSMIAGGSWALTDDLWIFAAENSQSALTSLKQLRLATAINAPTFTPDRNYAFNGTTQTIDTGFIPSANGKILALSNDRISIYERTNVSTNTISLGVASNSTRPIRLGALNSTNIVGACNSALVTVAAGVADSRGLTTVMRINDTTSTPLLSFFKNGVAGNTGHAAAGGVTAINHSLYISGWNSVGTLTQPRANSVAFACIGAAMTVAQELAQYNAVQTYMTAVGANV